MRRFTPSTRRRIDLERLYRDTADRLQVGHEHGDPPPGLPVDCSFTLDQLLTDPWEHLEVLARAAALRFRFVQRKESS